MNFQLIPLWNPQCGSCRAGQEKMIQRERFLFSSPDDRFVFSTHARLLSIFRWYRKPYIQIYISHLSIFRYISQLFTSQQWYARLCCIRMRSWSLADVVLPVLFCLCAAVSSQLKQVPSSFGRSGQKVFLYQVSQLNSHLPVHCRPSTEMLFLVLPWNLVRVSSW